ncbi:hypothetical protein PQE70_gp171 [Bacillus phage vB_BanS_Nate]|uniref:Uncharacterized protein n=1 Tax=Bacillus phage vB_BanS_Nate TaxID=2894788 RepID=A0AAE9CEA1_9CAUD|nr:hypothetical protein PQE70_gp171 [Bacillus phage vB_BanS_Nate]UGO51024.1 hypothetical protein NATE_171 [Bacillus phage vB_BanS_Nate]
MTSNPIFAIIYLKLEVIKMKRVQRVWAEYLRVVFAMIWFLVYGAIWFGVMLSILYFMAWIVR